MQTLILGLDAFDPALFERLSQQGRLPNLTRYAERGGYARLAVANPPQSEVSWTSIATGLDPGGHGIFDFVHRNPRTYSLSVSLLPTQEGPFGVQFVPPHRARTIFEQATRQGYPATALWWPATFPARPELPVRTLPGLGAPDIQGRLGVGVQFSSDPQPQSSTRKTPLQALQRLGRDRYGGILPGPVRKKRSGSETATLALRIETLDKRRARLIFDKQSVELVAGQWSPIIELSFKMGLLVRMRALTRVILTQVEPHVELYFLPLQLHPLHSPMRYGAPGGFVKEAWAACGPFLTLGWPQDTTGLEEGCISDDQFLDLCRSILHARQCILMQQLQDFEEGILAAVFDTLDRVQHMFWRDRPDIVESWCVKLDALVGRVAERLAERGQQQTKVIVLSDHGFANFDYKVHLNRWLVEQRYLAAAQRPGQAGSLAAVDWAQTPAYAVGLNSLYLNLAGREGQGCVQADERESLLDHLRQALLGWRGPDGRPVVQSVWRQEDAFQGPLAAYGPDLVVGYSPGYRASAQTGLGEWEGVAIEPNRDHWGADHCIDPQAVPGVLFCNQGLGELSHPSYRDIPALAIGMAPDPGASAPPPALSSDEDQALVEERLKSLGYL